MDGWSRLGSSLASAMSGEAYGRSYDAAMSRGHELQKKMMEAKIKSDEMRAREELDMRLTQLFPEGSGQAEAASSMLRMGQNFNSITSGYGNIQEQDIRGRALQGVMDGTMNPQTLDNLMQVYDGKPRTRAAVQGNTLIDPTIPAAMQGGTITGYGQGVLDNAAQRNRDSAAAAMVRANRPLASRVSAGKVEDAYESAIKAAAKAAYSDARLDDLDITGLTLADFEHALRTRGEVKDRRGNVIATTDIKPGDFTGGHALQNGPSALPGPTTRQAIENESIPDPARAMSGGSVSEPTPSRQQNAAETRAAFTPVDYGPALRPIDYVNGGFVGGSQPAGKGGKGTRAAPYRPTTDEEYDAIPVGSYFIDPEDGAVYLKDE